MLFAKKYQFFLYLFWVKTRLEIRLNKVLDKKEPFLDYKRKISESPKNRIFPKGLTHGFGEKCQFFLYLDLVKIRLEKMLNNFVEKEETKKEREKKKVPNIAFFQKVNPCFWLKKCQFFLLFCLA